MQFKKYHSEHMNEPKVDIFSDNIIGVSQEMG